MRVVLASIVLLAGLAPFAEAADDVLTLTFDTDTCSAVWSRPSSIRAPDCGGTIEGFVMLKTTLSCFEVDAHNRGCWYHIPDSRATFQGTGTILGILERAWVQMGMWTDFADLPGETPFAPESTHGRFCDANDVATSVTCTFGRSTHPAGSLRLPKSSGDCSTFVFEAKGEYGEHDRADHSERLRVCGYHGPVGTLSRAPALVG